MSFEDAFKTLTVQGTKNLVMTCGNVANLIQAHHTKNMIEVRNLEHRVA
jgi:hypothetical protein